MSWKDLLIAGTAYKALKQSRPPGVIAPPGYTITGMDHKGLGSKWKISYVRNENPNITNSFTISSSTSGYTTGADKWIIKWG